LRPAAPLCAASTNLAALPGSLAPYSATVACTVSGPHSEGGTNVSIYTLTATACRPAGAGGVCPNPAPGADYVERQVTATVER
jgi:MSHA biogenesis protein MshP